MRLFENILLIYDSFIWFISLSFKYSTLAFLNMHSFTLAASGRSGRINLTKQRPNKGLIMIYLVLDQCFPMRQIQTLMMTWSCPMLQPTMNQAVLASGKINFYNLEWTNNQTVIFETDTLEQTEVWTSIYKNLICSQIMVPEKWRQKIIFF